jgi:hypothetical protein
MSTVTAGIGPVVGRLAVSLLALAGLLAVPTTMWGQEPEEPAQEAPDQQAAGRRCDLTWQPATDATVARIFRQTEEAQVTYVSGGMIWTCGTATMEADSAVKYDLTYRVDLIGNVQYRDTIRTLESEELTYFELADRIVATGDVFLTRLASGSTLEGPKVEFLRAVSGIDEVTLATGRPHMVLRPENDPAAEPFEVDADETEFLGEEEARARGNVEIVRPDLTAAADSARFRLGDGSGVLFGDPWIEGEAFRLEGDTIRTTFEDNELRSVRASGTGHATGESFEVVSEEILVGIADEAVDAVWAYGPGRSLAVSAGHKVYGDSLRFVMLEGRIDSVLAIREAAAVQAVAEEVEAENLPPLSESAPGDPLEAGAEPDSLVRGRDTLSVPADTVSLPPDTVVARVDSTAMLADSLAAPADTASSVRADSIGVEVDSIAMPPTEPPVQTVVVEEAESDTLAVPSDTLAAQGDTAAAPAEAAAGPQTDRVPAPRLTVDATTNWVTGDTLYATFERLTAADSTAAVSADSTPAVPADSATVETGAASQTAADTAEAQLERLRVVGDARSFYAAVRDTTRTERPSRSYLMGRAIVVFFRDGEARRVIGEDAIGLYLDPADFEAPPAARPETGPMLPEGTDRIPVPSSDSLSPAAPAPDTVTADSVAFSMGPRVFRSEVRTEGAVGERTRPRSGTARRVRRRE